MDSPTTIFTSASTQTSLSASTSPPKRKRRPAGTPDPDADVIALSPKTLMESDRYVCEICNQGFQRDQNLQMHRRRHKVPWKLLKRVEPELRKRVYVCPELSCLHHNPCHALGDLVGIKKHYRRKHSSMKQWECDKCSKAYAVQSDYKAHLKTCGTRGHCCDCGRVFSRVESFIEHQDTCTAARNKKGSPSSDLETASLPSLAEPAAYHASIMPTNPSNFTEKVMKHNHLHSAPIMNFAPTPLHTNGKDHSNIPLHPQPVQVSECPPSPSAFTMNAHAWMSIPAAAPPPLITSPPVHADTLPQRSSHNMATAQSQATQDGSFSWETQPSCTPHMSHLGLQHHKAELQLLPTSKAHLNQLESSQSSVTWGRDLTSTNSTTSGTCSSPASKAVDDKCVRIGANCPELLPISGAASKAAAAPCKLQLSIGLSNNDSITYCGKSTPFHVSRNIANKEGKSEQLHSKATSMPWLAAWTAFPQLNVNDACHDVPNIGVAKSHSSLRSSSDQKRGITSCRSDAYEGAIDLELATGYDHHCSLVRLNPTGADKVHQLQQRQDLFLSSSKKAAAEAVAEISDQKTTKPSYNMQDEDVIELLEVTKQSSKRSLDSNAVIEESKLLRCNTTRESIVPSDILADQLRTERSNSLSGWSKDPDCVSELLQFMETPEFLPGTSASQRLNISFELERDAPGAAEAADVLLQKAREKLRRASAEKLEAEKAWREARREREQAEEELAKAQRIAEYNRMIALGKGALGQLKQLEEEGAARIKATCSSSTSTSPNSLANSQASSSSLQIRQLHAGGILCSAPSFITCPTCHHTQILYPSPSNMGTLFVASPLELAPSASTLISTPHHHINLPTSPTHLS